MAIRPTLVGPHRGSSDRRRQDARSDGRVVARLGVAAGAPLRVRLALRAEPHLWVEPPDRRSQLHRRAAAVAGDAADDRPGATWIAARAGLRKVADDGVTPRVGVDPDGVRHLVREAVELLDRAPGSV